MKDIMKAILIRALCAIAAVAIFTAYARAMAAIRERNGRLATAAEKAGTKASVTAMSAFLESLRDEIVKNQDTFQAADKAERENIMLVLTTTYVNHGMNIPNASVRDMYLSSVQSMVKRGFEAKA